MRKTIALFFALLLCVPVMAQKNATVEFTVEELPAELLAFANGGTSDKDQQKVNKKTVEAFGVSYNAMDAAMQQRVVNLYTYAVKAKMKGNPELMDFTRVLTAYASGSGNLEGWVAAVETYRKKNSKAKYVTDFVAWSDLLLSDRVLYRSSSSEWSFDAKAPFRLGVEEGAIKVWFDTPSDLHYASSKDWNAIHGTTGVYDYKDGLWQGEGGRLDWARTGLGAEACYADLRGYKAEVKYPNSPLTASVLSIPTTSANPFWDVWRRPCRALWSPRSTPTPASAVTSATSSSATSCPMWTIVAAS